ncbi:MAG: NifU family protein [Gemmataceae bacterium]
MTDSANEALRVRVEQALREHAAPAMDLDGRAIEVLEVFDGIATVRLGEACASCPATIPTLLAGLEHELRLHVPEIEILEVAR